MKLAVAPLLHQLLPQPVSLAPASSLMLSHRPSHNGCNILWRPYFLHISLAHHPPQQVLEGTNTWQVLQASTTGPHLKLLAACMASGASCCVHASRTKHAVLTPANALDCLTPAVVIHVACTKPAGPMPHCVLSCSSVMHSQSDFAVCIQLDLWLA